MNNRLRSFLPIIFLACLAGVAKPTLASTIREGEIDAAEWRLLPPYCPHTMAFSGYTPGNRARWEPLMGKENFSHMHHYCWALIRYRRAEKATTPTDQKRYLRTDALDDFYYVLRNTREDFILLPEVLTWTGRTELLLGKIDNADKTFAKARALKPDYWPAYSHWAEYLLQAGKKDDALAIVNAGLQHSPSAKVLHELLRVLGGKPGNPQSQQNQRNN